MVGKGLAVDDLERHIEAIQCYKTALQIDPNLALAWDNKAWALCNLERGFIHFSQLHPGSRYILPILLSPIFVRSNFPLSKVRVSSGELILFFCIFAIYTKNTNCHSHLYEFRISSIITYLYTATLH